MYVLAPRMSIIKEIKYLLAETVETHLRGDKAQVVPVQGAGEKLSADSEVLRGTGRGHEHLMLWSSMVTAIDQGNNAHDKGEWLH